MSGLIGGSCNGCGNRTYDCICKRIEFVCAKGHSVSTKQNPWSQDVLKPHHCEECERDWLATEFPMQRRGEEVEK